MICAYANGRLRRRKYPFGRAQTVAENGSLICAEILGLQGYEKAQDSYVASARTAEYYKTRPCAAKVESAARIFADYLREKQ